MGVEADYAPMDLGGGKKAIADADSAAFPPKSAACGVPIVVRGANPGWDTNGYQKKKPPELAGTACKLESTVFARCCYTILHQMLGGCTIM